MDVIERIKMLAGTYTLVEVNFLDCNGLIGGTPVTHVVLGFSNGDEFKITYRQYDRLRDFEFNVGQKEYFDN